MKPDPTEQELAELIAAFPPAPPSWVRAAQELPVALRTIDKLVERAEADAGQRRIILQDLEASLDAEGVEPRDALVQELRGRLS